MAVKYFSIDPRANQAEGKVAEASSAPTSVVIATIDDSLTPQQAIIALQAIVNYLGTQTTI